LRVLIFGATGMVGGGALRECLAAPDVSAVTALGRTATGQRHAKLGETLVAGLMEDPLLIEDRQLTGFDACFFCVGISSSGMSEAAYTQATYTFTTSVAARLARLNPGMAFVYVSGAGADSSGKGASMWARVRGRTENALLAMPFGRVHILRPGVIQPLNGARSKTRSYRLFYQLTGPLLTLLRKLSPGHILSTEIVGQAMLLLARQGSPSPILESRDIGALVNRHAEK
jgi:uncharacterized protein YbjT (DUF2867 family)